MTKFNIYVKRKQFYFEQYTQNKLQIHKQYYYPFSLFLFNFEFTQHFIDQNRPSVYTAFQSSFYNLRPSSYHRFFHNCDKKTKNTNRIVSRISIWHNSKQKRQIIKVHTWHAVIAKTANCVSCLSVLFIIRRSWQHATRSNSSFEVQHRSQQQFSKKQDRQYTYYNVILKRVRATVAVEKQ
jgi:hypothetical protein